MCSESEGMKKPHFQDELTSQTMQQSYQRTPPEFNRVLLWLKILIKFL